MSDIQSYSIAFKVDYYDRASLAEYPDDTIVALFGYHSQDTNDYYVALNN
jgi:hypothetical protein